MKQCPISFAHGAGVGNLVPHFYAWRENGFFPDGGGRLRQPNLMLEAFDIMAGMCRRIEKEKMEKETGKK